MSLFIVAGPRSSSHHCRCQVYFGADLFVGLTSAGATSARVRQDAMGKLQLHVLLRCCEPQLTSVGLRARSELSRTTLTAITEKWLCLKCCWHTCELDEANSAFEKLSARCFDLIVVFIKTLETLRRLAQLVVHMHQQNTYASGNFSFVKRSGLPCSTSNSEQSSR